MAGIASNLRAIVRIQVPARLDDTYQSPKEFAPLRMQMRNIGVLFFVSVIPR